MREIDRVIDRYRRREDRTALWEGFSPAVQLPLQEKERAILWWLTSCAIAPPGDKRLLEVGCGSGDDLLLLVRLGFDPANLVGIELIEQRAAAARHRLAAAVRIVCGDAAEAALAPASFDVVMQSTVFTSLLDDAYQEHLARRMWELVKPGGGILWFDFVYDNPRNRDVRGVPLARVRELFAEGHLTYRRIGLAPPIARRATKVHPGLYGVLNVLRPLRTHVMCWIRK